MNLMKKVANKTLKHNTLSPSSKLIMASMVSATQFFLNGFLSSFRQLISRNSEGYCDSYSVGLKLEARAVHCYPGKSGSIVEVYQPIFRQSSKVMISLITVLFLMISGLHNSLYNFFRLYQNAQFYNHQ